MRYIFLLLGTATFAQSTGYVGLHAGLSNHQYEATFNKDLNAVTGRPTDFFRLHHGTNAFQGGIHAGWLFKSGFLAIGPEVSGDYSSLNNKIYSISYVNNIRETLSVRNRGLADFSLRFGAYANDRGLFYIKPGLSLGRYDVIYKASDGDTTANRLYQDQRKTSKSDTSFKIGLGYEGNITNKITFRGELSHAFARDQRLYIPRYDPQNYQLEETTIKIRRSSTSFILGISYYI